MAARYLVIKQETLKDDKCYNFIVNTWDVRFAHRILEFLHEYIDYLDGDECTIKDIDAMLIKSRRFYFYSVPYPKICKMTAVLMNNRKHIDTQLFIGKDGNCEFDTPRIRSAICAIVKPSKSITGTQCDFCFTPSLKLWRCKGCMTAKYCSRRHQKNSWKMSHRFVCREIGKVYLQMKLLKLKKQFVKEHPINFGVLMIMRDCICDLMPGQIPSDYNPKEQWGVLDETSEWRSPGRSSTYSDLLPSTYALLDILGLD